MFTPRFLVVSLGNPAPYTDTLHSAGHLALLALQKKFPAELPPFSAQRLAKKSALASIGSRLTLLQCPTLMNVSGPWIARAWREVLQDRGASPADVSLVLVHDDLEEELGAVRIRPWSKSHRGHNGIKSVNASLRPGDYEGARWSRISVGIGRPDGRDPSTVSDYVLRKASRWEKSVLEDKAAPGVFDALGELEKKWGEEFARAEAKQQ